MKQSLGRPYDVLIVEDNHEQANLTKLLLERHGYRAHYLTDSSRAFEQVLEDRPLVVILDLMMPQVDGLHLCQQIKSNPQTANTRVVIYSGKIYDSDRRKALQLGADAFFVKPTRAAQLIKKLNELLAPVGNGAYSH
ncbi:MAG: response regulator [Calditrichaeota bacterium]|nr:MAG: response regulator [Calditrichota bacterium]